MKTVETKNNQNHGESQAWWHTTVTLACGRQKKEDSKFKAQAVQ